MDYLGKTKAVGKAGVELHTAGSMHHRLPPIAGCMHVGIQEIALGTDRCGCQKIRQRYPAATQTQSHCNNLNWVMLTQ